MSLSKLYVNICSPTSTGVSGVNSEDESTNDDESKHAEDPLLDIPLLLRQPRITPIIAPSNARNKSGRPTKTSSLRFCPQPQSIVATKLRLERENKTTADVQLDKSKKTLETAILSCDHFYTEIQTERYKNIVPSGIKNLERAVSSDSINDNTVDKNAYSLVSHEGIQFTLYVCDRNDCTFIGENERQLNMHKKRHRCDDDFVCDRCAYRARAASDLRKHYRIHSNEKPYPCPHKGCDYKGRYSNNLDYHTRKMHPTGKPLKCEENGCDFTTWYPPALRIHSIKKHSGEKTISCDLCPYRCYLRGELRKHMVSHSIVKPFACDFPRCGYTCKLSSNLRKHKRIHTEERPYACEQCSFRSNFISSLKAHRRTHTDERPYCCHQCGYRCNSASNLKKHISQRHREGEEIDKSIKI